MQQVRIIRIPPLKVVSSGPITSMAEFEAFDRWWSAIDAGSAITPRDFLWYNEKENHMEWIFAIPDNYQYTGGYPLENFPGGLYAVATARDTQEDSVAVREQILKWVRESGCFDVSTEDNGTAVRSPMAHVITPNIFKEKMGYHLSDHFVPVVAKE